jgi:hypothetical protein
LPAQRQRNNMTRKQILKTSFKVAAIALVLLSVVACTSLTHSRLLELEKVQPAQAFTEEDIPMFNWVACLSYTGSLQLRDVTRYAPHRFDSSIKVCKKYEEKYRQSVLARSGNTKATADEMTEYIKQMVHKQIRIGAGVE